VMDAQAQGEQLGYGLDVEAMRVISDMPDWTPGEVKGKKVKVYYTLPIIFTMAKEWYYVYPLRSGERRLKWTSQTWENPSTSSGQVLNPSFFAASGVSQAQ
jgi:hypothetical protein